MSNPGYFFLHGATRQVTLLSHVPIFFFTTEANVFNIKTERTQQSNEQMSIHRH